ncbi:methylaspartate ammonia-lyase [Desulfotomaculum copahuensis]|uniref:methylaspartate ammonia-lyase n=1 Tax=Desulfotomaculum copahuensis TaxID=1838280 RepID=A0A1B7LE13_9FIRM|nr:methylaspartate ammonia-lyase [Desulfotomaculum copahuensis]OAT81326.1 methylaspartate ammonia-lyase [Desulfotomaculum copahuensis]
MRIVDVLVTPGLTGFYFDDQLAIKAGAVQDGFAYVGEPLTPGFSAIRQRGEAVSVMLLLEDGQVAYGDCAAVQYSGAGGRDPLFLAADFIPLLTELVAPRLKGREITTFREMAGEMDHLPWPGHAHLHTAVRYGVTQALLDAVARTGRLTMAGVLAAEYGTELAVEPVPIFVQTGDDRYLNADKAILKRADVLPHGLINHVRAKLGERGELLLDYIRWLKGRIEKLGGGDYRPVLHIDVYGTVGQAFANDPARISAYFARLEEAARPYKLRIEGPVDAGGRAEQIALLGELRRTLARSGIQVAVVADEWCNTWEDIKEFVDAQAADMIQVKTPDLGGINNIVRSILYARTHGVGAYLGGTCNETDRSAQVCVHIALATRPGQMLAKPGMGLDEGYMIVYNEMMRTMALYGALDNTAGCSIGR